MNISIFIWTVYIRRNHNFSVERCCKISRYIKFYLFCDDFLWKTNIFFIVYNSKNEQKTSMKIPELIHVGSNNITRNNHLLWTRRTFYSVWPCMGGFNHRNSSPTSTYCLRTILDNLFILTVHGDMYAVSLCDSRFEKVAVRVTHTMATEMKTWRYHRTGTTALVRTWTWISRHRPWGLRVSACLHRRASVVYQCPPGFDMLIIMRGRFGLCVNFVFCNFGAMGNIQI